MIRYSKSLVLLGAITLLLEGELAAAEHQMGTEQHTDLIHSDVPLFGFYDGLWPRGMADEGSIGCMSKVALGDWGYNDRELWRLDNYGVFHCAIVETRGHSTNDLASRFDAYSHFVSLGKVQIVDGE